MPKDIATLDDDTLFALPPHPVPGIPQRSTQSAFAPSFPRPPSAKERVKLHDLNFKVEADVRRKVKDLAYELDVTQVEVLKRALDALIREIAASPKGE